ncbi:MAG TPA: peptidoglycan DD-metalloendopeptidase family protein [Burkholderiaceae bacterium]|jgi:lipoprotein NlpD
MFHPRFRTISFFILLAGAAALSACTSVSLKEPAPVENRAVKVKPSAQAASAPGAAASAPAVDDTKPQPGTYVVKPGDSLIRIALDNGQNWRDISRWNQLDNPNRIEVGQTLRVVPPGTDTSTLASGVSIKPITSSKVESRSLDSKPASAASAPLAPASAPAPTVTSAPVMAGARSDDDMNWGWPAAGAVVGGFDDQRSKGLDIGGKAGDPVLAAADGRVVYAGSGLRGYGNLVIIKHNDTYLTAYAHNQTLLVKDEQVVRKGQKIAEMGSTDTDQVKLHFEVRKLGKPIDPARLLPTR